MEKIKKNIPKEVTQVTKNLEDAGFEAYLIGGCVRDILLKRTPKDWDITTNASPEQIITVFGEDETFYENTFGTVGVKIEKLAIDDSTADNSVIFTDDDGIVEVTPYRTEGTYTDARRPDAVRFTQSLTEDLKRRDFTINALAYRVATDELIDQYDGMQALQDKTIKAVGNANDRFSEDALRMMRALRFSAQLDFAIDGETMMAIANNATLLEKVSHERIRDEFNKIIMSDTPITALGLAEKLGMLIYILPELREGIGCEQGKKAHKYHVFEHNLRAMQHAADKNLTLIERLGALLHDVGKPHSRRKKGMSYTFYGHEVVGARMAEKILTRMKYPKDTIKKVSALVRWHMFFSDPDIITLSAVRRMITNIGTDNMQNLLNVRMCDRIGSGRPTEQPFRFRKYQAMVEEALRDPISVGMLKIDGGYIMKEFHEKPGPRIGWMLHALLEDVLDDAKNNTEDYLKVKVTELLKIDNTALKALGISGVQKQREADNAEVKELHKKHNV